MSPWTLAVPTVAGFYWLRSPGRSGTAVLYYVAMDPGMEVIAYPVKMATAWRMLRSIDGAEWCGPLVAPE